MNKWYVALEFDTIIEQIKQYGSFSLSKAMIEATHPVFNERLIQMENDKTRHALNFILAGHDTSLSGVSDVSAAITRASKNGVLSIESLVHINKVNHVVRRLSRIKGDADVFYVSNYLESLQVSKELVQMIDRSFSESYEVLDSASKTYAQLKKELRICENQLQTQVQNFINKNPNYISEPIAITRNERVVVLVKTTYKNHFKGIVHGESASKASAYVEPPFLIDLNNKKESLQLQIENEIERICMVCSQAVKNEADQLLANLETLAILDTMFAKAKWGLDRYGFVAQVGHDQSFMLEQARHPLIAPEDVIANTIAIPKDKRTLLITGPNTGGKTVNVKMIGLFTLMAYSGIPLLASRATLPVFDQVFADIGDDQSIVQSLSTFSSHLAKIAEILKGATHNSLVIFDELGSGTDPDEGESLAIAILDHCDTIGCMVVATTHYNRLKEIAYQKTNTMLASVEFDIEQLKPTYRFLANTSGFSNALDIAATFNMPQSIIDAARDYYESKKSEQQQLIDDLQHKVFVQEQLNAELMQTKDEIAALKVAHQQALDTLAANKADLLAQAEAEAQAYLQSQIKEVSEHVRLAIAADQQKAKVELETLKAKVKQPKVEVLDENLAVGDFVHIKKTHQIGEIITMSNDQLEVDVNNITFKVKKADVVKSKQQRPRKTRPAREFKVAKSAPMECVIVGMRTEEAKVVVDRYINDCILANRHQGFIVHGIGSGVLKKMINRYLNEHPGVKSVKAADHSQGGPAVTVVSFQ